MIALLGATFGCFISTASGYLLVAILDGLPRSASAVALRLCLAFVVGAFLHGMSYLVWARCLNGYAWTFWLIDAAPLALAAAVWWRFRPIAERGCRETRATAASWDYVTGACVALWVLAIGAAAAGVLQQAGLLPFGQWDAWWMWNYRARMLYLAPPHVADLYASPFPHPDYPLGWPLVVARVWRYAGTDTTIIPRALAVLTMLLHSLVLAAGVAQLRGRRIGALAGTVLLGSTLFIRQGASQYADQPLTLAMLGALIAVALLFRAHEPERTRIALLVGVLAGGAAWTKNEGIVFAAALGSGLTIAMLAIHGRNGTKTLVAAFAGFFPAAVLLAAHRALATEGTDLFDEVTISVLWGRATDPVRYATIVDGLRHALRLALDAWVVFPMLLAVLVSRGRRPGGTRSTLTVVGGVVALQAVVYVVIYLLFSSELRWHLVTSADRLVLHLWPSVVLLVAIGLPAPAPLSAQANSPSSGPGYSPKDESGGIARH